MDTHSELTKRGRKANEVDPQSKGGRVRSARQRNGLTVTQLANLIGVKHQTITKIENNQTNIPTPTHRELARVLNDDFGEASLKEYLDGLIKLPADLFKPLKQDASLYSKNFDKHIESILFGYLQLKKKQDDVSVILGPNYGLEENEPINLQSSTKTKGKQKKVKASSK